jgi:hypothetical protein
VTRKLLRSFSCAASSRQELVADGVGLDHGHPEHLGDEVV